MRTLKCVVIKSIKNLCMFLSKKNSSRVIHYHPSTPAPLMLSSLSPIKCGFRRNNCGNECFYSYFSTSWFLRTTFVRFTIHKTYTTIRGGHCFNSSSNRAS